jgi:hypothetical protein
MFGKRKKKPEESPAQVNRIQALAGLLQEDGGLDKLETELAGIDPASLEVAERELWHHLRGIVPFRQGNRTLALERYREAAGQCPGSGPIQFSLGQEYEFRGQPERMLECFDRALFPGVPAEYSLAEARYAYLWGRYDRGRAYIEPLLPVYLDLKILDTTFLDMRGLPFFQEVWAHLAAFSSLDGDFTRLEAITAGVLSECSDLDKDLLEAELEGLRTGDHSQLKERLRISIADSLKRGWPCGHSAMRLGILQAQEAGSHRDALQLLDSVAVGPGDFPWLEDIRLLARCEIAHRSGDAASEQELREQFLSRQPMLLEPDHAVNFGLLEYQETLKGEFRRSRLSGTGLHGV